MTTLLVKEEPISLNCTNCLVNLPLLCSYLAAYFFSRNFNFTSILSTCVGKNGP